MTIEIQKKIFGLSIFFICALTVLCQTENKVFKDVNGVYQLSVPANWIVGVKPKGISIVPPKENLPNIDATYYMLIVAVKLAKQYKGINIREWAIIDEALKMKKWSALSGTVSNSNFITINGKEWWKYEYKALKPYEIHTKTWETIQNDTTYSFVYNTASSKQDIFEDYVSKADEIANSFSFLQKDLTVYKKESSEMNSESKNDFAVVLNQPVSLDVGAIDDFHEGFAIFRKGERFGILDSNGTEFIPLGRYNFNIDDVKTQYSAGEGFHNGMCIVRDVETGKGGFIDSTSRLVVSCIFKTVSPYLSDGYGFGELEAEGRNEYYRFFLDKKGRRYALNVFYPQAGNRLFFLRSESKTYGTTIFYRKDGSKAFETKANVGEYGDGLYRVQSREIDKEGFMDTTGKLIIPYKFSGTIKNFSEGLALYEPKYKDEYQFAFINKNGEEAIHLRPTSTIKNYYEIHDFKDKYASCKVELTERGYKDALVNYSGQTLIIEDLFKQANPQVIADLSKVPDLNFELNYRNRNQVGIYIKGAFGLIPNSKTARKFITGKVRGGNGGIGSVPYWWQASGIGMIDYTGRIIIPPIFDYIGPFDLKSGLAKAIYLSNEGKQTQGFINLSGEFVFILKENIKEF